MTKIHYEIENTDSILPLKDCLCKKVPFPKLTRNWEKVTCKYCLKLKEFIKKSCPQFLSLIN
ncbi:MAG: hypothetical protein ACFFDN_01315 [Candidatus Hodarchaeota archaeon]